MATQTSCAILQGILNQQEPAAETLFQLNHVRVCEPGCGENIKTNSGERLFVPVRLLDFTGVVHLRVREKAALELSGCSSVEEFVTACTESDLRFPLLASVRVHLRPKSSGASEHAGHSQSDTQETQATTEIQAIIVEAIPQLWDAAHAPNASVMELSKFLPHLPTPASRMVVARVRDITIAPHAGVCVKMNDDTEVAADYVLVLVAATEKSGGQKFGTGYRVITKKVIDCGIWDGDSDISVSADCVSICTMDNLVNYKMAPPKPGSMQYSLALISGLAPASQSKTGTIMIDAVEPIATDHINDYKKALRKLATLAKSTAFSRTQMKRTAWSPNRSPFDARKVRKLAEHPTDASLPDSTRTR